MIVFPRGTRTEYVMALLLDAYESIEIKTPHQMELFGTAFRKFYMYIFGSREEKAACVTEDPSCSQVMKVHIAEKMLSDPSFDPMSMASMIEWTVPAGILETLMKSMRECNSCGLKVKKLRMCSGCEKVWYCDRECQRQHWPAHKAACAKTT